MCEFRPGDEVERFRSAAPYGADKTDPTSEKIPIGFRGVVSEVVWDKSWPPEVFGLRFSGVWDGFDGSGFYAGDFRKIAKRSDTLSIESFLVIRPGQYEEPRKVVEPVRRKEKA